MMREIVTSPVVRVDAIAGRARTCMICDAQVRLYVPFTAGDDVACESPQCRMIMSRRAHVGPEMFRFLIENYRRQRREQQRLTGRNAHEAFENESIRDAVNRRERLPASHYPLVTLPTGPQSLERVPQGRRERYREHLADIIAEAVSVRDDDPAPVHAPSVASEPIPLAEQLCTLCQGGCCSIGGERAFLSAATIRQFMRLRPELPPDRVAAEYLDRLADRTVAGSCINHTATGCSLPRQMRADICNTYYCKSMRGWQAVCGSGKTPLGAFVIQREQDNWNQDRTDLAHDVVGIGVVTESGAWRVR